jgi:acetyltransferase-like isoleucine patch superfamily enzyme
MKPISVPVTEVNSEEFLLAAWEASERRLVKRGEIVACAETTKAIYDVLAPEDGYLHQLVAAGAMCPFQAAIGYVFETEDALAQWLAAKKTAVAPAQATAVNATVKARELAEAHKVDLAALGSSGRLVTQKIVEDEIARRVTPPAAMPLAAPEGVRRIAIIGAALGATQVLEIMRGQSAVMAVALFDDNQSLWGTTQHGLPVVGGTARIGELFSRGFFDAAVVAISTSVPARTKFREHCKALGLPLANVVDPSCRIAADAKLGEGNVLNAFCFVGSGTVIGDNNFFSAFNSIDHHCQVGSDLSTGPSCVVSGIVKIGSRVRMGTGVFVQPYVEIGDAVQIASGAIIVGNVPSDHAVKTKVVTTEVKPLRR